jgi:hypothetical protein
MMPTRRRTRAQTRAARIARERKLNAEQRALEQAAAAAAAAERHAFLEKLHRATGRDDHGYADYFTHLDTRPPGHQPDYGDDPPPF